MEQQRIEIDFIGYPEAKAKGVSQIQLIDGEYLLRRMKFLPDPDKNGQPVPAPTRVVVSKEVLLAIRKQIASDLAAQLAGIDAMVADIDAAKPL